MAISVNWGTKVITVPQADLTFISGTNYTLDTNQFHLDLRALEDDVEAIPFLDTHKHTTATTIGGVTYARFVEIINGYTVTFENGSYSVNLINSNNNIQDKANLNSVSIRSQNAAGLIVTTGGGSAADVWAYTLSGKTAGSIQSNTNKLAKFIRDNSV